MSVDWNYYSAAIEILPDPIPLSVEYSESQVWMKAKHLAGADDVDVAIISPRSHKLRKRNEWVSYILFILKHIVVRNILFLTYCDSLFFWFMWFHWDAFNTTAFLLAVWFVILCQNSFRFCSFASSLYMTVLMFAL